MLRPQFGDRVLEVGAGIGNLVGQMMGKRQLYLAAEKDPLYLHALRNRFLRTPNVQVRNLDPEDAATELPADFDTVIAASAWSFRTIRRNW